MCEQCEARQQSRHVTYNNTRRDPRAAEFYLSKEWRELRPVIMSVYEYVDIYALYVEHQLITLQDSDPIHHIIELEEDWEQRLNPLNLIPLSHRTHNTTVTQVNETTQQIVRSRTCGLKDFYIALVQSNTATAYTAGTPVKLARAIKAKIDEKWTSEKIYSDDNTEEVITSYEGTDVELEINALAPQDRVILFGQLYEKGFLRKSSDDRAPEVAVGWRERKLNGKYEFKWLYVGKFAEGISEEASTKEGKLSPTTKSIKGSFYERSIDNLYEVSVDESNLVAEDTDAATAIKDWFSKVQEAPDAAA